MKYYSYGTTVRATKDCDWSALCMAVLKAKKKHSCIFAVISFPQYPSVTESVYELCLYAEHKGTAAQDLRSTSTPRR